MHEKRHLKSPPECALPSSSDNTLSFVLSLSLSRSLSLSLSFALSLCLSVCLSVCLGPVAAYSTEGLLQHVYEPRCE